MPLFTKDNAANYGKAGAIARWEKPKPVAIPLPLPEPMPDTFIASRLMRVREQLDRIDEMLLRERDPGKLDRLAAASMRLSEQEFALAGRPKPGQLRPVAPSKPKRSYTAPGSGPMPEPVQAPEPTISSVPDSQTKPSA